MSNFNYQDYLKNNPLLKEGKKVGELTWKFMNDDKRMDALLSVVKDPDEASEYVELDWKDLPARINPQNMRLSEQLEFDEDFGTGDEETLDLASDVVFGRISYKDAREKASKAEFSMKELNNAIAYVEDLTGKSAPSYSIDEDYDPDAEQDDEDVPNPVDDEGRPLGEAEMKLKDEAMVYYIGKLMDKEIDKLPEDPLRAYMNMLTQDQMDHDAETLSREIGENKMNKMDKINERLNVSRDALTKVYKEVGATTFSQMVLNLRDENTLDELLGTMKSQYVGLMSEARDYRMTYPSYKVEEFNDIGDMAHNGILNLMSFAEQHKPELASKIKAVADEVMNLIYDDMEEFDTQPRIGVKGGIDEKAKVKLEKGLEKNKKDIKEQVELLSEEKDEEKIQTHKTRLQELLDVRKKAEKLLEQEEEDDTPIDKKMDKFKFTQQQQTLLKGAIQGQPTKFREVLLNLMQQIDDLTQGDESNNSVVKSAIATLGRGL
jgi:AraC-like DNA-binding protein